MPNWCENELTLTGKPEHVAAVLEAIAGEDNGRHLAIDFNRIVPMPEELADIHSGGTTINGVHVSNWRVVDGENVEVDVAELVRKYGAANWYDWSLEHWGTKWNASEAEIVERTSEPSDSGRQSVTIRFDTAWSPAEPVIEALAKAHPELKVKLRFWEGGCGFKGHRLWKRGALASMSDTDYHGHRGG